jgi:hypothetical protein
LLWIWVAQLLRLCLHRGGEPPFPLCPRLLQRWLVDRRTFLLLHLNLECFPEVFAMQQLRAHVDGSESSIRYQYTVEEFICARAPGFEAAEGFPGRFKRTDGQGV